MRKRDQLRSNILQTLQKSRQEQTVATLALRYKEEVPRVWNICVGLVKAGKIVNTNGFLSKV